MRYIIERTARAALTVWAAVTVAFLLLRLIPGSPLTNLRQRLRRQNPGWSEEQLTREVERRQETLVVNPEDPVHTQYFDYMASVLTGDLGQSLQRTGTSVGELLVEHVPFTVFVMVTATFLVFAIAITWGALMAYYEGGIFDSISSGGAILASSVPFYVLAFVLIIIFSFEFSLLPSKLKMPAGQSFTFAQPVQSLIGLTQHALLPIASVVLSQAGLWALTMRGNSIQILGEDYVRVARLRGLADRRIATRYVARNAILPVYTGFLTLIGFNLGASIVLEEVFEYRGMGWLMFRALIQWDDYSVAMGTFIIFTLALVLAVYVADLTYGFIDPRVKQGGASEAY